MPAEPHDLSSSVILHAKRRLTRPWFSTAGMHTLTCRPSQAHTTVTDTRRTYTKIGQHVLNTAPVSVRPGCPSLTALFAKLHRPWHDDMMQRCTMLCAYKQLYSTVSGGTVELSLRSRLHGGSYRPYLSQRHSIASVCDHTTLDQNSRHSQIVHSPTNSSSYAMASSRLGIWEGTCCM